MLFCFVFANTLTNVDNGILKYVLLIHRDNEGRPIWFFRSNMNFSYKNMEWIATACFMFEEFLNRSRNVDVEISLRIPKISNN